MRFRRHSGEVTFRPVPGESMDKTGFSREPALPQAPEGGIPPARGFSPAPAAARTKPRARLRTPGMLFLPALAAILAAAEPAGERWWSHVRFLADDRLAGRETGSAGYREAAQYVAGRFDAAGLRPAGTQGFFQPVEFLERRIREPESNIEILRHGRAQRLVLGRDAYFVTRASLAPSVEAEAVFAGYGVRIPGAGHDDFQGLDLRGKIAGTISGTPSGLPPLVQAHYGSAAERRKALLEAGAAGTLTIPNPRRSDFPWSRAAGMRLRPSRELRAGGPAATGGPTFAAALSPETAARLFEGSPHRFEEIAALAGAGKPLPRFPLHWTVRARAVTGEKPAECVNVSGVLRGSDPTLSDEYIVLSAHLDHIGAGAPVDGDSIYNGAMDNASGVATLLEVARSLQEKKVRPKRSLLFLAVTAEEGGLLGSRYFASRPGVRGRIVANINTDMFLPIHPLKSVVPLGLEESTLRAPFDKVAARLGLEIRPDPEPQRALFVRSDQYSFILQGVPALSLKMGFAPGSPEERLQKEWIRTRYHAPSDDVAQPVDLEAAAGFTRLVEELAVEVANMAERPRWEEGSFFRTLNRTWGQPGAGGRRGGAEARPPGLAGGPASGGPPGKGCRLEVR